MASTTTEERQVGEFQAVSLDGVGVINFVQEDATSLKIEAEPEALPLITTEVKDGTLHIQTQLLTPKVIHLKHPPVYTITSPTLNALDLRGAGGQDRSPEGRSARDHGRWGRGHPADKPDARGLPDPDRRRGQCPGDRNRDRAGDRHHRHRQLLRRPIRRRDGQGQHRRRRPGQGPRHAGPSGRHRRSGSVTYIGDPRITPNVGGLGRVKRA